MNNLIWIIDFRSQDFIFKIGDFPLPAENCKYVHVKEILNEEVTEASIDDFFNKDKVKSLFEEILSSNDIYANLKVFVIANSNDDIYKASLFTYKIKSNASKLKTFLSIIPKNAVNCYLISFWENAWETELVKDNVNALYELNLFQSIPDIKVRPFDFVFFYKDFNGGIKQLGYNYIPKKDPKKHYHNSKVVSLIFALASENITSQLEVNHERWSLSFGCHLFYINIDELYSKASLEILNKLKDEIFRLDSKPWNVNFDEPISEKIKNLNFDEIYKSICFKEAVTNDISFYELNTSKFWNWFSVLKINLFFNEDIRKILFSLKTSRKDFLDKNYKNNKEVINENFEKLIDYNQSKILTPIEIFDGYFKNKKFSLEALRKEVINLSETIVEFSENSSNTSNTSNTRFFSLNKESEAIYSDFENTLGGENDINLNLNDYVNNHLLKIKHEAENVPHPYSLVFKSIILGTILSLILYIPINNFISDNPFVLIILSSLVFLLPMYLNWGKIDKKMKKLHDLKNKFDTLNKYLLDKKLNNLANLKAGLFYENYLNKCNDLISDIDLKSRDFKDYLENQNNKNNTVSKFNDEYSITNSVKSVIELPNVQVSIKDEIIDYKTLLSGNDVLFDYYDKILSSLEVRLSNFLDRDNKTIESINNAIINDLIKTPGNVSSVTDLFYNNNLNVSMTKKEEFLNLLPPFNNSNENIDSLTTQIVSNKLNANFNSLLLGNNFDNIYHFENEQNELSILMVNQPYNKLLGLFSSSLGGNNFNYFDSFKSYTSSKSKDHLNNKLTKFVIEEIVKQYNHTDSGTDKFKSILSHLKSFDLDNNLAKDYKFDIDDLDNLDEEVKKYLEYCKEIFRVCVRTNIEKNQNS
jgi:hypothetical protein